MTKKLNRSPILAIAVTLLLASLLLAPSRPALAQQGAFINPNDPDQQKELLRGLSGMYVTVEDLRADAERDGLRRSAIQTDVELRLRTHRIKVITREEAIATPSFQNLYILVNTGKVGDIYTYSINMSVIQLVTLWNGNTTFAPTWKTIGRIGMVGSSNLPTLREEVRDLVDQFINDYLAVNG